MFTGIIQQMGMIKARREATVGTTFLVEAGDFSSALRPGDSVSINGACHTVEASDASGFEVTSIAETFRKTTMGDLLPGDRVNLELAATLETALGGHIVQGHVDGVATVVAFDATHEEDRELTIELPSSIHDVLVDKGSVAIDGVSLTVARFHEDSRITIAIIPFTIEHTVIGNYREGDRVNVEGDVIGKYVRQYLERIQPAAIPPTGRPAE